VERGLLAPQLGGDIEYSLKGMSGEKKLLKIAL